MRGVADTKTVVSKSTVLILIGGNIHVAVVEIIERIVPVAIAEISLRPVFRTWEYTYVLSKPMPWVRIWTVGLLALLTLGAQNWALILYVPNTSAYPVRAVAVKFWPC